MSRKNLDTLCDLAHDARIAARHAGSAAAAAAELAEIVAAAGGPSSQILKCSVASHAAAVAADVAEQVCARLVALAQEQHRRYAARAHGANRDDAQCQMDAAQGARELARDTAWAAAQKHDQCSVLYGAALARERAALRQLVCECCRPDGSGARRQLLADNGWECHGCGWRHPQAPAPTPAAPEVK